MTLVTNFSGLLACCIVYGIFASGIPGNGPLVYTESFQDVASAMGLASIGRSLAAFSMGPLIGNFFLSTDILIEHEDNIILSI
jgi:MFS family permease